MNTDRLLKRREFTQKILSASCAFFLLVSYSEAGPARRRMRRRVRRRTRRRIRRRIRWRVINGTRVVIVPVNIAVGDELIMDDGSIATITKKTEKSIVVTVDNKEQALPAHYKDSVDE